MLISVYLKAYIHVHALIYFAKDSRDQGSTPGHLIPETLKMVLPTSLLNTQHYKIRIKGKVELSKERSSAHPYIAIEKGDFWSSSTTVTPPPTTTTTTTIYIYIYIYVYVCECMCVCVCMYACVTLCVCVCVCVCVVKLTSLKNYW